jgi:hypothetical protein
VVTLTPTEPGSGTVETSNLNGWTDDATGTITVNAGNLARIEIRTASGGGGVVLNDSTALAGDSWTLYAAGYDLYGNYLSDVLVAWSVSGDPIGSFVNADSASSNTFDFTTVNTSRLRIDKIVGSNTLTDYSGLLKVNAGDPATLAYVSASNFSGQAGSTLSDSLGIRVFDAFGNAAPNVTVTWEVTDPSGELNPSSDLTDLLGVSRSKWKLKSTTGADSAYAIVAAIPDTLIFRANVLESTADRMVRWDDAANPASRSGTVRTALAQPLVIQVFDNLDNPVPGISVTFGVVSFPAGGSDYSFGTIAGTTGSDGLFQSTFTPGSKVGDYLITAYNEELINSGSTFFTVSASAGAADRLVFVTESGLQDTVATTYGDSVRVRVEDAYQNVVTTGVTVNWQATGSGSVDPAFNETNSSGIAAAEWTLRQESGLDTLYARSTGLPDVLITANLSPAEADNFVILSSQDPITVGTVRLLEVQLRDVYGNPISAAEVIFNRTQGNGYFGSPAVTQTTATTNSSGVAQALYTASDDITFGSDIIQVSFNTVLETITLSLQPGAISYYEFDPAGDQNTTAGTGVAFTLAARDAFGNAVANTQSVNLTTPGSTTAEFNVTSPLDFGGASTVNFTVTDTVVGSFTVRAVNTGNNSVNGESGLITVSPAGEDHFVILSSTAPITVSAERLLQVRLEDQYNNVISGAGVTFTRIQGDGYFGTPGTDNVLRTTNANGIAEALYTASSSTSFGSDQIEVNFNLVDTTIVLSLQAGAISYYEFVPAGDQNTTAGTGVAFTLTARDALGNPVANTQSVNLSTPGSTTASFNVTSPVAFGGASSVNFTVTDNVTGSFTVRAVNTTNSSARGESGLITVSPAGEDHFIVLSSTDPITVGAERLLQVRLEDQYNNVISGAGVTFTRIQGDGYFGTPGTDNVLRTTNANGIAEALYTASSSTSFGSDQIEVNFNLVDTTIVLPLQAGIISYYEFSPANDQNITAGDSVNFTLTARDVFGNAVANTLSVNLSTPGSSTAEFDVTSPVAFGGASSVTFAVTDTVVGSFTVRAVNTSNSNLKGESGLISVSVGPIDYVLIRSEARNGGIEVGALTLSTDDRYTFYSAGYDQYGNYIDDVNVNWSTTPDLESVTLSNANKFTFNPTLAGVTGTVRADHATAGFDETGDITITAGVLARLRIKSTPLDNGPEVNDVTLTADDDLVLYAVGYDADGNFIGRTAANWTLNNLSGSLEPDNPTDSVTFIPQNTGSGSIRATANADPSVLDNTGTIAVTPGAISYVIIRSEPNGTGQEVAAVSLTVGQTLTLYAAGYDSKNNFSANANVNWSTTGTLSGLSTNNTNTYVVTLTPTEPGSGTVETSNLNGWTNDATGTVTVSAGNLARIEIRTASGGGGVVLNDSTARAGDSWTLYAAGYDLYGNYLGDVLVAWSVSGDPIGSFVNADSASSNSFDFTTVNTSRLRIDKIVGSNTLTDYSGLIKVNAGDPATLAYVSASNFSGQAGSTLSDSLGIRVFDTFGNRVPGVTVNWNVTDPTGELNPALDLTDGAGVSRSKWKLKNTTGEDSVYAVVNSIPDSLIFRANVLESSADRMVRWDNAANPELRTGIVRTALSQTLAIQVLDSLDNPVPGVSVTFGVVSFPVGGSDYSFGTIAGTTGSDGLFQSTFTPGSKVGNYLITAYNEELINSGSTFFTVSASAAAANRLVFVTESGLQDTVATTYGDSVRVRVEDAYQNVVTTGVTVNWQATATGSVNPASSVTNSSGIAAAEWTLRQESGLDTLYARSTDLPDVFITASLRPGAPYAVLADSGSQRSGIAGGTQIVRARLEDQFGNVISGRNVLFETVSPGGFVSNAAVRSDTDGLAQTTYTTPTNLDTSYVRAFIANVDTAVFELYGVRYISGSLDPALVAYNDTVSFYIDVTNPGTDVVSLDTSRTTFSFANQLYTTTLDSPLTLSGSTVRMKFKPAVISSSIGAGRHTPVINFAGEDTYAGLNGKLSTDAGELSVEPISIEYVRVPNPKIFPRGTVVTPVLMNVRNSGNTEVTVDTVGLTFSPAGYDFQPVLETPITSLLPGQERTLEFTITVPADAPADTFIVDGFISCTCTVTGAVLGVNRAHQNDILIVTDAINLAYVNFSPQRVSEGQTVTMQIQIDNLGDYDILVDRNNTRLEFGSQQFTLSGNQALGAGNVSTITFNSAAITLTALNSPYEGILYLQGTENGNVVRDTLYTASLEDSLEVQTIASLEFAAVELSQSAVRQGQSGETLTIRLNNSGQADAVVSNSDQVAINITSVPNAYQLTALQSFPFTVAGGTLDSLVYQIKVAADAPLGIDTFTVDITYNDANSNQSSLLSDPTYFDFWEVFSPGRITITSVQSDFDSVSTGQENIPVVVRIRNDGQTTVRVDSIQLKISRGFYVPSTLYTLSSKTLNAAQADTFNLSVSIDPASVTGSAVVNASAYGVIVGDLTPVQDLEADTTHSWLIQRAVEILASNNQPTQISEAQDISPTVTVSNDGDARLLIDETNSYIEAVTVPAFRRSLVSPLVIEGKQSNVLLNFESGPENIGEGTYDLVLHLEGTENGAPYVQDINLPNTLLIQTAASLEVEFISAIPENISRNADTLVTILVRNNGQADLQIDSLIVIPYGIPLQLTPTLPFTLSDNASNLFDVVINIPADADTGLITLDARGVGRDLNSNAQTIAGNATSTDSWNVFTPALVTVTSITSPDSIVRQGDNNIPVQITLRNNGGAPARINSLELLRQIGLYSHQYPPLPFTIQGHSDTTVIDLVDVLTNSALGTDTLRARINYTDIYANRSRTTISSEFLHWTIIGGPTLIDIVSVQTSQSKVSQGQSGVDVRVRLKNMGSSTARINSLSLVFSNGAGNYVLSPVQPALPFDLTSGVSQLFTVPAVINSDAQTGSDTVYASVNYTDLFSNDVLDINDPDVNDTWLVQLRPSVLIDSVTVAPAVASNGQTGLRASVTVSNAPGLFRADAQIDSVELRFALGGTDQTDQFNIFRLSTPTLPLILQEGKSSRFDFNVNVPGSTAAGLYDVNGYVVSQDLNDGLESTVDSTTNQGTLEVQTAATLVVNSITVIPDTVSQNQTHARVYVDFQNNGGAAAEIRQTELLFDPSSPDFNPILTNTSTPFTIAGNQRDTLIYAITITDDFAGPDSVGIRLSGRDLNSNQNISTEALNVGGFLIQIPANVSWVAGSTSPNAAQADTTVQFTLRVSNSGEATVRLDSTTTTLELQGTSILIPLSGTSPDVVAANPDTTDLIFRETLITGIAEGEYNLILTIRGTSNGAPYTKTMGAGVFAFGDSLLSITSINVVGSDVVLQGASGLEVLMTVSNTGEPLTIDQAIDETTLFFRDPVSGTLRNADVLNLQRTDTLTILRSIPSNQLRFQFDLTENYPVGLTHIYGQISLENNLLVKESNTFAELTVQTAGNVLYVDGTFTPDTIVARQNVSFRAAFADTGSSDVMLDPLRSYLTFENSVLDTIFLAGKFTVTGNDTTTLIYETITVPNDVLTGQYNVNWFVGGTLSNGTDYTNQGVITDGLDIIPTANVVVTQTDIDPDEVNQGQENIAVTYTLQNTGQSTAIINGINHIFRLGNQNVSNEWLLNTTLEFPDTLTAGQSQIYPLDFNVGTAATAGYHRSVPTVNFTDIRTPQVARVSGAVLDFDSVLVSTPGILNVLSVRSDYDSVSTGQQDVEVVVRVRNEGQTTVQIDSIHLNISRGLYVPETLYRLTDRLLTAGATDTFRLFVDVEAASPTGAASLDAAVFGRNINGLIPIRDLDADTTDSWLIQTAVDLIASDNRPTQVSVDQDILPTVTIRNNGSARVLLDTLNSYITALTEPSFRRNLTAPTVIEGNAQNIELSFESGEVNLFPGTYALQLHLEGIENKAFYSNDIALPNDLLVQTAAQIEIASISAIPENITRDADTLVTIVVNNPGEADLRVDSLLVIPYGQPLQVTPALPFTISGLDSRSFDAIVNIPADADTGLITLDARGVGRDLNSSGQTIAVSANSTDSWNVFTRPQVVVTAMTAPDSVARLGQNDIPVSITIRNNGGSPVRINSLQLIQQIGLYNHDYPPVPFIVSAYSDTTVIDLVDVLPNSATGRDTLRTRLNYTNLYSGKSSNYLSSEYLAWQLVSGEAAVSIVSVNAVNTKVSRGQSGAEVQVRLRNNGGSSAIVNTLDLIFANGNDNYVLGAATPALPFELASGLEQFFSIAVSVNEDAQTGSDTVHASINITQTQSGDNFDIVEPTITDTWLVQLRPFVSIDSVSITPAVASTGQSGLRGSVYLSNAAGANRAEARIDTVQLRFLTGALDQSDQFNIVRLSTPTLPLVLQAGTTARFDFDVAVLTTTPEDTYEVNGYVVSRDLNDGQDSVQNTTVNPDTLVVQNLASLAINNVTVIPDTVSQRQTHARVYVDYQNNGSAPVEIRQSALSFDPALNFRPVLTTRSTPFTLNGSERDTLIYALTIPDTYNDVVYVGASISGRDLNSATNVSVAIDSAASFLIQTPADVFWVAGSTSPSTAEADTTVSFRLSVINSGEATVKLDSNLTTLRLENTTYAIPLSGSSAQVIQADPDTTELVFRETFLTGIPEGEYNLILTLRGTTNDSVYAKTMNAGVFAFGDSLVSITSIQIVGSSQVLQGDTALQVIMIVSNSGNPLSIDPGLDETTLLFRDPVSGDSRDAAVLNLQRQDTLTILRQLPNNRLEFRFDLSESFPLGITNIFGQISLENNQIVKQSTTFAELNVQTSGNADYVVNTLRPDTVIARQMVSFRADFLNSGSSDVVLNPDSTWIEILGSGLNPILLAGKSTAGGGDTTTLNFNSVTIPADILPGEYDLYWQVRGKLANQAPYANSGTVTNQLRIVPPALITVNQTDITPERVRQGESNIPVSYTIQNTGQSDAIITGFNHIFRSSANDVSNDWLLNTNLLFPDTLRQGQQREYDLLFSLSASAQPGYARSVPRVNFYDWRTPQFITQSSLVLLPDSALVLRPARIRIDSLIVVRDSAAPNAPFVNIDSTFNMKVVVSNTGADSIQSTLLNIFRNEQLLPETISISSIPAAPDSQRVAFFSQLAENLGTVQYKVRVNEARDVNGTLIAIDQPLDNVENVIVQQPSQLWISAEITAPEGARDGIVSLNQEFTIQARVNRSGQSPIGPGTLSLRLPPNFQIVTAADDTLRNFDVDNAVVQWQIRPTGLTDPQPFDSLEFYMHEVPIDSNTLSSAIVSSRSEKLAVRVENPGTITTLVAVTAPQGATDGVVSAGQLFTLTSTINFVNSIAESGRTAKIILPGDYSVQDSSLAVLPETNSLEVNWNIVAPRGPGAGFDSLYVQINAFDANSGQPLTLRSAPTLIRVVTPAQISLASKVISPPGAADRIVSTQQEVIIEASVSNIGQAGIDDSGSIQLRATNGILFKSNLLAQKTISAFALSAYTDTLLMPAVAGVGEVIVHILPEELPNDANSGNPVLIRRDSINIALQIVDRADLFVRFDKATAIDDTLIRSINQLFMVKALVRNRGTATVDTSRWLRLDLNQSGLQFNNDQARKTFGLTDTVTWNLIAPSNPAKTEIYVRADSEPLDENDGLNAFRNAADAVDTVQVEFKAVSNIVMNSIFVKNSRDSLTVSTEQDSISISADIFFDPILDAQRAVTLILPAGKGYASLDQNLTRTLTEPFNSDIRWLIRASGKAEEWSPVILRSTARSQSIPGLPVQTLDDTLYIRTQPRATLSLALQIVEPSGAMDDSISYGQAFKLQALLRNRPDVAGVSGQGLASLLVPDDFSLLDTLDISAAGQKPILVDQPVFWWIRASESSTKISSKAELLNLLNTKISAESRSTMMEGQSAPRIDIDKAFELKKAMSGQAEQITVRLDALPLDINSSKPAFILNNPESRTVYLEEKAAIIVQSVEAPDTLSTGQSFDLTISGQLSGNLVNAAAFVQIPAAIGVSPAPLALDFENKVRLRLTIPDTYQGSGTETINIFLVGTDANTGQQSALSNTVQHILRIEARPELALSKPLVDPAYVITEGLISRGQEIEIQVQPIYSQQTSGLPFAPIKGSGVARLEAPGFSFVGGHTADKPFSQIGQNLTWRIKAPIVDLTANIKIKFEQLPLDKNSNLPAAVEPDSGLVLIPVRVRQKTVTVTLENDLVTDSTFTVDRQNITMLVFKVSNEEYNDNLHVDRITLAFHSNIGEPSAENLFLSSALVKLFKTITVEEYTAEATAGNLGKGTETKKTQSFIDYTVNDSSANPLELRFQEPDVIASGEARYYRVKGEFQDNTLSRGFRLVLNDVHVFDFDADNPLDIIDALGKPLAQSKAFSSKMLTVISSSLEEDFYNYPNPFGREYPETFFTFRLEQGADVDIRIFTLLGELVWSWKGTALPPGVYDRFVRWDGRNDRGNVVLNGVYLCYIDMKAQGGQNKRFITKIAYIK